MPLSLRSVVFSALAIMSFAAPVFAQEFRGAPILEISVDEIPLTPGARSSMFKLLRHQNWGKARLGDLVALSYQELRRFSGLGDELLPFAGRFGLRFELIPAEIDSFRLNGVLPPLSADSRVGALGLSSRTENLVRHFATLGRLRLESRQRLASMRHIASERALEIAIAMQRAGFPLVANGTSPFAQAPRPSYRTFTRPPPITDPNTFTLQDFETVNVESRREAASAKPEKLVALMGEGLSARTARILTERGVDTPARLYAMNAIELELLPGMGRGTLNELQIAFAAHGHRYYADPVERARGERTELDLRKNLWRNTHLSFPTLRSLGEVGIENFADLLDSAKLKRFRDSPVFNASLNEMNAFLKDFIGALEFTAHHSPSNCEPLLEPVTP